MSETSYARVSARSSGDGGAARTVAVPDEGAVASMAQPLLQASAAGAAALGLVAATRWQRVIKRTMDVVVSGAALLVLAPVLLLAALAVKLTSAGPALYAAERIGRHGRPFTMYKFRSMYVGAAAQRARLLHENEATGPVFKMRRDPRVTPVGRVLRKMSIDELPQLINVLLGDMSLVGPRPPLRAEYDTYTERQRQRLAVNPGITCTWQVSGRSNIPFEQWIEMDLDYIRRWSVVLDIVLLLRTIPAVITGRGAY